MALGFVNKEKSQDDDYKMVQKKFLSSMSYDIRNPLNEICGITEIAIKNLENNGSKEMLRNYLEIIRDAGFELQKVVDERFAEFEKNSVKKADDDAPETFDKNERRRVLNNLRIMVVEDNETSALIAKELMQEYGALVTICTTGDEAFDIFKRSITGTYDVILMDIKMPGMDGYETTDKIRKCNHQQAKSIPIIAMTAETFVDDIHNALKAGMNAHISKPIHIDKIVSAINKAIV